MTPETPDVKLCPLTQRMDLIFKHQTNLMEVYREKGKIPQWPLDITNNQKFMKDLIDSLIEELVEAFEAYEQIFNGAQNLAIHREDAQQFEKLTMEFNEELSDTLSFMVEIMIFSNIDVGDILGYYSKLFVEKNLPIYTDNCLNNALSYGTYVNTQLGRKNINTAGKRFKIIPEGNPKTQAGRVINHELIDAQKLALFDTIKYLKLASNTLKSKHWRDSTNADIDKFHEQLMEAWLYYWAYLNLVDCTELSLYYNYLNKNKKNLERVQQGW